ncbi:MAG: BamA/TamA family outer membrane protein [Pseudomonadota bacterium]
MRCILILATALFLTACASGEETPDLAFETPETQVAYEVELTGVSDEGVKALLESALALYRQRDRGAQSLAFLRRRATGDIDTIQKVLRSEGWFEAEVEVDVEAPTEEAAEEETPIALARVIVTENRRYALKSHDFALIETGAGAAPPVLDSAELGSPVGEPATASDILAAEQAAVAALRASGRPYAQRIGREAVADPETAEIEVFTTISAGPAFEIGDPAYDGGDGVKRAYLDTYVTWEAGTPADPAALRAYQNELIATGLFDAASVDFPEEPPTGETLPVEVRLEEAAPRTVSGGVRYSTDVGPAVRAGFEHRNLFGANETLTLEAIAGLEEQSLDTRYRIPQYARPGQDLVFGLNLRRIDDEAFEELGVTPSFGIERELTDFLTVGAGGLLEFSRIEDIDGTENSYLVGAPLFAAYDSSDDRLDPSEGVRARLSVTPFAGAQGSTPVSFLILDANASTYFDLTGTKDYIFAVRGRVASILSGDLDVVSPTRWLYSGGGGSVRGYAERFIGPLDADGEPTGGLSTVEIGAEMRVRATDVIGLAGFVEAASVSEEIAPVFDEGVQIAVGGGVRYLSPIGPLRFDIGFPVNGRDEDDLFQVYISIGQAF